MPKIKQDIEDLKTDLKNLKKSVKHLENIVESLNNQLNKNATNNKDLHSKEVTTDTDPKIMIKEDEAVMINFEVCLFLCTCNTKKNINVNVTC